MGEQGHTQGLQSKGQLPKSHRGFSVSVGKWVWYTELPRRKTRGSEGLNTYWSSTPVIVKVSVASGGPATKSFLSIIIPDARGNFLPGSRNGCQQSLLLQFRGIPAPQPSHRGAGSSKITPTYWRGEEILLLVLQEAWLESSAQQGLLSTAAGGCLQTAGWICDGTVAGCVLRLGSRLGWVCGTGTRQAPPTFGRWSTTGEGKGETQLYPLKSLEG